MTVRAIRTAAQQCFAGPRQCRCLRSSTRWRVLRARDVNDIESDMRQYDRIEVWSVINTTTAQLGNDLTLKSIAGYRDFESFSTINLDSTRSPAF